MSNDNVPPAIKEIVVAKPDRRLKEIERRLSGGGVAADAVVPGGDRFPGFSFPAFALADLAPSWYATRDISYIAARISCRNTGGGTGSFRLDLNGASLLTLSLLSGESTHLYAAVFSIGIGGRLDGEVTATAGQLIVSVQLEESA